MPAEAWTNVSAASIWCQRCTPPAVKGYLEFASVVLQLTRPPKGTKRPTPKAKFPTRRVAAIAGPANTLKRCAVPELPTWLSGWSWAPGGGAWCVQVACRIAMSPSR